VSDVRALFGAKGCPPAKNRGAAHWPQRREGELAVRAALGASTAAFRRTLLAESVLLCGAGAILGVVIARPMLTAIARYASRFSVRALDLAVDRTLLWVGVGLALISSVLLAFVPRLPSGDSSQGLRLSNDSVRVTTGTNRRLQVFAVTQIAASFVLLAGAGALLTTLIALQQTRTGVSLSNVLAVHVPVNYERPLAQSLPLYREAIRQISALPGVEQVAVGTIVPWREARAFFDAQFTVEGYTKADGEDDPRASFRMVSPGFFKSLGVPIIAGRDFSAGDRADSEKVVIISESVARRMSNSNEVVNRKLMWTDPVMKFIGISTGPRRIVGVAADLDDENIVPAPKLTVYHPMEQEFGGGRLFVHAKVDPYTLVTSITKIIRGISAEQPVERAATLEDVRAEVLAPDRLNTIVFGGFAVVALEGLHPCRLTHPCAISADAEDGCGNGVPMETTERFLEISHRTRDSHIPTSRSLVRLTSAVRRLAPSASIERPFPQSGPSQTPPPS
jgi:hypothetical protein